MNYKMAANKVRVCLSPDGKKINCVTNLHNDMMIV